MKLLINKNLLISMALLIFIPFLISIENLDKGASANVLERAVSLIGIIFLTPIYYPEADDNTLEIISSKSVSTTYIYTIRVIVSLILLSILIACFTAIMSFNSCVFPYSRYLFGGVATALFLGSISFVASAISNNTVTGYFAGLSYHIFNYFVGDKLGKIFLFSMSINSFSEKYMLFALSVILIIAGLLFGFLRRRCC